VGARGVVATWHISPVVKNAKMNELKKNILKTQYKEILMSEQKQKRENSKKYYEMNKDTIKEKRRNYYMENKEKINEKRRAQYSTKKLIKLVATLQEDIDD